MKVTAQVHTQWKNNLLLKTIEKGLTFYQTRSHAIIFQGTRPAYCIPKVVRMETGGVIYMSRIGSEHAQRPEGQVVQRSRSFQSNQPIPNPTRDRTGQPVVRTIDRSNLLLELTLEPCKMEGKTSC